MWNAVAVLISHPIIYYYKENTQSRVFVRLCVPTHIFTYYCPLRTPYFTISPRIKATSLLRISLLLCTGITQTKLIYFVDTPTATSYICNFIYSAPYNYLLLNLTKNRFVMTVTAKVIECDEKKSEFFEELQKIRDPTIIQESVTVLPLPFLVHPNNFLTFQCTLGPLIQL